MLQKRERLIPEIYIRKPKQILTYSMFYNVEPTTNLEKLKKRIEEAIKKESLKKSMGDIISHKMTDNYLTQIDTKERDFYLRSLLLYLQEDDHLKEENFRTVTLTGNDWKKTSYPMLINLLILNDIINVKEYTYKKFERLNQFLSSIDNKENSIEE